MCFQGALRHLAIGEMLLKCYTMTATVSSSEFQQQGVGKEAEEREFLEPDLEIEIKMTMITMMMMMMMIVMMVMMVMTAMNIMRRVLEGGYGVQTWLFPFQPSTIVITRLVIAGQPGQIYGDMR